MSSYWGLHTAADENFIMPKSPASTDGIRYAKELQRGIVVPSPVDLEGLKRKGIGRHFTEDEDRAYEFADAVHGPWAPGNPEAMGLDPHERGGVGYPPYVGLVFSGEGGDDPAHTEPVDGENFHSCDDCGAASGEPCQPDCYTEQNYKGERDLFDERETLLKPGAPFDVHKIEYSHANGLDPEPYQDYTGNPQRFHASTDGIRYAHIVEADVADDLRRLAAADEPQYLYRGINIDHPGDDYTGETILQHLNQEGQKRGTGIGRHWSTMPEVSEGYAEYGEETEDYDSGAPNRLQVMLRGQLPPDGSGLDPNHTGRGIDPVTYNQAEAEEDDPYEASERTMLPGTPMSIDQVRVRRPGQSVWAVLPVSSNGHTASTDGWGLHTAADHLPMELRQVPLTDLLSPHGDMAGVLHDYDHLGHRSETPDAPVYLKARLDIPGKYELADGHHRVADAIRNGKDHVEAYIDPYEDDEPYDPPFYDFSQHMGDRAAVTPPTVPVADRPKDWQLRNWHTKPYCAQCDTAHTASTDGWGVHTANWDDDISHRPDGREGIYTVNDGGYKAGDLWYTLAGGKAHIDSITVHPDYRGGGVGQSLVERLHQDFPAHKINPGTTTQAGHDFMRRMQQLPHLADAFDPDWEPDIFPPHAGSAYDQHHINRLDPEYYRDDDDDDHHTASTDYRDSHQAPGPQDGAPMHDVTQGIYPASFYDEPFHYWGSDEGIGDWDSWGTIRKVRGNPDARVKVHRALPLDVAKRKRGIGLAAPLNTGDWVTPSYDYAHEHGMSRLEGNTPWTVVTSTVPASQLHTNGDSLAEWGYNGPPTQGYEGANAAGKRKYRQQQVRKQQINAETTKDFHHCGFCGSPSGESCGRGCWGRKKYPGERDVRGELPETPGVSGGGEIDYDPRALRDIRLSRRSTDGIRYAHIVEADVADDLRRLAFNQDLVDRLHGEFHQWHQDAGSPKGDDPERGPLGHWPHIEQFLFHHYPMAHLGMEMGMEEAGAVMDGTTIPYLQGAEYETGPQAVAEHGYDPKEIAAAMLLLHNRSHGMRTDLEQADQDRLAEIAQKRMKMQRDYEQRTARLAAAPDWDAVHQQGRDDLKRLTTYLSDGIHADFDRAVPDIGKHPDAHQLLYTPHWAGQALSSQGGFNKRVQARANHYWTALSSLATHGPQHPVAPRTTAHQAHQAARDQLRVELQHGYHFGVPDLSQLSRLADPSEADYLVTVNPRYDHGLLGRTDAARDAYKINCQRSVLALDARKRGYNVEARPNYRPPYHDRHADEQFGDHDIASWWRDVNGHPGQWTDVGDLPDLANPEDFSGMTKKQINQYLRGGGMEHMPLAHNPGPHHWDVMERTIAAWGPTARAAIAVTKGRPGGIMRHIIHAEVGPDGQVAYHDPQDPAGEPTPGQSWRAATIYGHDHNNHRLERGDAASLYADPVARIEHRNRKWSPLRYLRIDDKQLAPHTAKYMVDRGTAGVDPIIPPPTR